MQHAELAYMDLLEKIINEGASRKERNGETLRVTGESLKFDVSEVFPLFVGKKMHWASIIGELEFFLNGITDIRFLWNRGISIWDKDWARHQGISLDQIANWKQQAPGDSESGANNRIYYMGEIYGAQWRDFNNSGTDQFANLLNSIAQGGTRRDIVTAWNPITSVMENMTLPPCHMMYQVFVDGEHLDMVMYQRSADMFLGVPFNVASYALLLKIIAAMTGKKARILTMNFGDLHIYKEHLGAVNGYMLRKEFVTSVLSNSVIAPKLTVLPQSAPAQTCVLGDLDSMEAMQSSFHNPQKGESVFRFLEQSVDGKNAYLWKYGVELHYFAFAPTIKAELIA